jgi:hypothetical protein
MPRRRKPKSKRKQDAIRHNCGIAAWRRAASEYLRKGKFIHLPKKGTEEHARMKARQKELIPVVQKEIDEMIAKEKEVERSRKLENAKRMEIEIAIIKKRKLHEQAEKKPQLETNYDTDSKLDKESNITTDVTMDTEEELVSSDTDDEPATLMEVSCDSDDGMEIDDWI